MSNNERTLRVWQLTPDQRRRFEAYLESHDHAIWEAIYAEQQAADVERAATIREDFKAGRKVPDTPFNREALQGIDDPVMKLYDSIASRVRRKRDE